MDINNASKLNLGLFDGANSPSFVAIPHLFTKYGLIFSYTYGTYVFDILCEIGLFSRI